MLSDRELASIIWVAALLLLAAFFPKWRRVFGSFLVVIGNALRTKSILVVFVLFFTWTALWVLLFTFVGAWDLSLLKDTLITTFAVGLPILARAVTAKSGSEIWRMVRNDTIGLSVLLAFYLNLASLPLWGELILQPVAGFIAIVFAVAQTRKEWGKIAGCFGVAFGALGVALIGYTTFQTIVHFGEIDLVGLAREFALSVWLPVVMIPYFYGTAFFSATQSLMHRMSRLGGGMPARAQLGLFLGLRFSVRWAKAMNGRYNSVSKARTFREASAAMRNFRNDVREREAREVDRIDGLRLLAGELGADSAGLQIDRREFHGTKEALRFIHTAQALRYERLGDKFWDDLTDMVLAPTSRYGLPEAHGFTVETSSDRKKFRAWRTTPSGWVLGIGAKGRFGEYLYSAEQPPNSWPGDPDWVDGVREIGPPDWDYYDGSEL